MIFKRRFKDNLAAKLCVSVKEKNKERTSINECAEKSPCGRIEPEGLEKRSHG